MIGRIIEIEDLSTARSEMLAIGADKVGVELMAPKAVSRVLKLKGLKPAAANIVKQEMLSFGGEAATAYGSINQSVEKSDLLIFGTLKQLSQLAEKLKLHQFGLPAVAAELKSVLNNYSAVPEPIKIKDKNLVFGLRTYIMGVLNVTPDSFSDSNKFMDIDAAVSHAKQMIADGADIIDIGGESTRPGAAQISAEEELKRVPPGIKRLAAETEAPISIDTTKARVAKEAVAAGAAMINDISGLHFDPEMAKVAAKAGAPIVLMHIQGQPANMQSNPCYSDLLGEVIDYLNEGLEIAKKAGILLEQIIVDPGIGFGKTVEQNLEILKRLRELKVLGRPVLVGVSRKTVIGKVLDLPVDDRLEGTAAAVALSIANGADLIRVHDVKEMSRVAKMTDAIVRLR
ncbi:MAG: dihydropteroate synthase [Candidatus Margulisbacteria bacterium]|nr:dihydropteroate synthase [Candidatus Margulisiibacteriota bacterium]